MLQKLTINVMAPQTMAITKNVNIFETYSQLCELITQHYPVRMSNFRGL